MTLNYRRGSEEIKPWKLADCDYKCPLNDFIMKTRNRIPTDREAECHSTKHHKNLNAPKQTPLVLSYKGK